MRLLLSISVALLIGFVPTEQGRHHHKLPVRQDRYYDHARDAFNTGTYNWDVNSKKGPKHWSKKYPLCSGEEQSPIDITTKDVRCDDRLTDFTYDGYDTVPSMPFLINRFHDSWQVSVFEYEGGDVFIEGAWLPNKFSLFSIYFWAGPGSMHQIDGNEYSLQIGLFHWNHQKYSSYIEAENNPDGVVHLSVFVQADNERSSDPQNKAFSDAFENVIDGAQQNISCFLSFPISSLLPSTDSRVYYKYHGSYYTPPCHESITYAVFQQPVYITQDQLERYRKVFSASGEPAKNNGRPIQPLNGRIVSKLC